MSVRWVPQVRDKHLAYRDGLVAGGVMKVGGWWSWWTLSDFGLGALWLDATRRAEIALGVRGEFENYASNLEWCS